MTFGRTIAEARKKAGISQKDLAAAIVKENGTPISAQFLNDVERDRRRPGPFIINSLARLLKLDADGLHFLAGQVPPDILQGTSDSNRVEEAATAFRKTYTK